MIIGYQSWGWLLGMFSLIRTVLKRDEGFCTIIPTKDCAHKGELV